jgi:hypothetical protein
MSNSSFAKAKASGSLQDKLSDSSPDENGNKSPRSKRQKARIPKALREQVWLKYSQQQFSIKCLTPWCQNQINAFDFHCGHMQAEAKGGSTTLDNLIPICARCNLSMGTTSFSAWATKGVFYNIHTMNAVKIGDTLVGPANYMQHTKEVPVAVKISNKRFWCC